jgi:hypothetical protein
MDMITAPYYPIIYVRGYAGTQHEVEDTVATPYMGFNDGSTKYRQSESKDIYPWVFESPLIRLMKDFGYVDAYTNGQLTPSGPVPPKSVWIFRYYDIVSKSMGEGEQQKVEFFARKLRGFIREVRAAVLEPEEPPDDFQVYLVAHSMGGLVCRCYLQNPAMGDLDVDDLGNAGRKGVAKLFTYATPHGGIDLQKGLGWLEGLRDFLNINESATFGPKRMSEILDMKEQLKKPKNEDPEFRTLNGRFPPEKVFCLVGTDSSDYGAAAGLARRAVGPLSDGLVLIRNAYVFGAPTAYVHRSHSGHYGIVNSEEGYQNLKRFLFGDTRAELWLDKLAIELPRKDEEITANYYFDTIVVVRGVPVEIHRRSISTGSAILKTHDQLRTRNSPLHLHTLFLSRTSRVNTARDSLGFMARIRITPEYFIKRKMWFDDQYTGQPVFEDGLIFEVTPQKGSDFDVAYGWTSQKGVVDQRLAFTRSPDSGADMPQTAVIPFNRPMVSGQFIIKVSPWN